MNVKQAIDMMLRNPAISFPYEADIVNLINTFVPDDKQLDVSTVQVGELLAVIEGLDPTLKVIVYNSVLESVGQTPPLPPAVFPTPGPPSPVIPPPPVAHSEFFGKNNKDLPFYMFFVVVMAMLFLVMSKNLDGAILLEAVKLMVQLFTSSSGAPPASS